MKKFMNKLKDSNTSNPTANQQSGSSTSSFRGPTHFNPPSQPPPAQYAQQQPQQYAQPSMPPPPPQQQQYSQPGFSQPPGPPPAAAFQQQQRPGVEDPFAALRRYDTVFIVDDSESMEMFWDETASALVGVVEKATKYDEDGIDIYFFNSQVVVNGVRTASDVRNLFRRVDPRKSTPTARALKRVTEPYMQKLEAQGPRNVKPLNLIILTDGAPDRNESPEGVIVDVARRLDAAKAPPMQLGFSFVQIGQDDEAQQALTYLDDHLKTEYGIRDICDTTLTTPDSHLNSEYLLKALLGGVNRKIDRQ